MKGDLILIKFNLKQLLNEKNMTMSDLSSQTGISRTSLSKLATGKSQGIQFDTLNKIVEFFSIKSENRTGRGIIRNLIEYIPNKYTFIPHSFFKIEETDRLTSFLATFTHSIGDTTYVSCKILNFAKSDMFQDAYFFTIDNASEEILDMNVKKLNSMHKTKFEVETKTIKFSTDNFSSFEFESFIKKILPNLLQNISFPISNSGTIFVYQRILIDSSAKHLQEFHQKNKLQGSHLQVSFDFMYKKNKNNFIITNTKCNPANYVMSDVLTKMVRSSIDTKNIFHFDV